MDTEETTKKYKFLKTAKRTELLLIILVLPLFFGGLRSVKGSYVVAGVGSHVTAYYGDEKYDFDTYKTKLIDAVEEQDLLIYDQDGFSIDRETKLNGGEYTVNITKSLPVLINDNGEHKLGRTIYSNARKIVAQNNIEVYEEDIVESELITDPVTQNGAGQIITITRAPVYKVIHDGKQLEARTWETIVKNILAYIKLEYTGSDYINPGLNEKVENGDTITVSEEKDVEIVITENVPYKTIYKGSTSLALGQEKVTQFGTTGKIKKTYKVTYRNGKEISRVLLKTKIITQKKDAVILRGAETGSSNYGEYSGYVTSFYRATWNMVGKHLLVTNLDNGKSVKVRIIGSGPSTGPLMDLGITAFQQIGGTRRMGVLPNVMVQLVD